jgi:hypothetical protein
MLSAADFEESDQRICLLSERESRAFKTERVVPWDCGHPVSRAGDGYLSRLQGSVISGGESPILGKHGDRGIRKITADNRTQIIQLLLT